MGAVPHELLQHESFSDSSSSQNAPAWVSSMVCSPSGTDSCSPHGQFLPSNLLQHRLLSQLFLLRDSSSMGFPQAHSLLQASSCSNMRSSTGCRWISAQLPHHLMVCRGISVPAPGSAPAPPSSLTLLYAELFLSRILTPISSCNCSSAIPFPPS